MSELLFTQGTLIVPNCLIEGGAVEVADDRIIAIHPSPPRVSRASVVDLKGGYLAPGYVDVHVHGGDGADFIDGTEDAFRTVIAAHTRHGTTSILPTTTVARHEQHLAFLGVCRRLKEQGTGAVRILGAHFYGPYFSLEARGCH